MIADVDEGRDPPVSGRQRWGDSPQLSEFRTANAFLPSDRLRLRMAPARSDELQSEDCCVQTPALLLLRNCPFVTL